VLGSNFAVNPPAGSTASSTTYTGASSSAPSTVPSPVAKNPDLASPSSSTVSLEPWDPRSCTATGGEGP